MRVIFLLLFLLSSYTFADEIDRIDSIVNEIDTLRSNYTKVQEELEVTQGNLKKLEEKNNILVNKINICNSYTREEKNYNEKIKALEIEIKSLKNRAKKKPKISKEDKNIFPHLKMKEQYKNLEVEYTKANTFRTNKEAKIYNMIDGSALYTWEEGRSFTSNEQSSQWVKITGYFVEKVWQASNEELWIKLEDARLRESNR